jgi:hypothetical protein
MRWPHRYRCIEYQKIAADCAIAATVSHLFVEPSSQSDRAERLHLNTPFTASSGLCRLGARWPHRYYYIGYEHIVGDCAIGATISRPRAETPMGQKRIAQEAFVSPQSRPRALSHSSRMDHIGGTPRPRPYHKRGLILRVSI